ncbi:MAG TPA: urease accessory UreF family protein [Solirubrobacteraceae bacterium]
MGTTEFLAALQLADSALPIGRYVQSSGLEAWLRAHGNVAPDRLEELVEAVVCEAVAPLDGAVVAHAQRASSLGELTELDALLTARKLVPSARRASQICGRQLAALAVRLVPGDALVTSLGERVKARETTGNLAVVEGTVARSLGLCDLEAVLVELRSAGAGLLSAATRLNAISPVRAQIAMARLAPSFAAAAEAAVRLELDELSSTAPELEICALAHEHADARMFAS